MTVNFDLSIMPQALNLSRVKLSGELPSVAVHFSEDKWWLVQLMTARVAGDYARAGDLVVEQRDVAPNDSGDAWTAGFKLTQKSLANLDDQLLADDDGSKLTDDSTVRSATRLQSTAASDTDLHVRTKDRKRIARSEVCRLDFKIDVLRLLISGGSGD